jgi:peptide/nickel transport system substrate-binding protein
VIGNLQAVGIRAACARWSARPTSPRGARRSCTAIIKVITAAFGNAATRLEPYATKNGVYAYGSLPEIDDLYVRQARELDPKKREAMVHQIQQIIRDKVTAIPALRAGVHLGRGPAAWPRPATAASPASRTRRPFEELR